MHRTFEIPRKAVVLSLTSPPPRNLKKKIREFLVSSGRKQYRKNKPQTIWQNAAWHFLLFDVLLSTLILSFLQHVFPKVSLAKSSEIKVHSNYIFSLLTGEINNFLYHFWSIVTFIYISLQSCRIRSVLLYIISPPNHWSRKNQAKPWGRGQPRAPAHLWGS